jgi:hypothetical protein
MEVSRILRQVSGGNSGGVTPVPIPNTEVKPASADGTWGETPWESRSPPDFSPDGHPRGWPSLASGSRVSPVRLPAWPPDAPVVPARRAMPDGRRTRRGTGRPSAGRVRVAQAGAAPPTDGAPPPEAPRPGGPGRIVAGRLQQAGAAPTATTAGPEPDGEGPAAARPTGSHARHRPPRGPAPGARWPVGERPTYATVPTQIARRSTGREDGGRRSRRRPRSSGWRRSVPGARPLLHPAGDPGRGPGPACPTR